MIYEGKILFISEEQLVGKNELPKVTMVLEEITDREYKGGVAIDFMKDKVELTRNVKVGDVVKAHLNFRCNEYNGRYYNSINCWRLEQGDAVGGGDDLPF